MIETWIRRLASTGLSTWLAVVGAAAALVRGTLVAVSASPVSDTASYLAAANRILHGADYPGAGSLGTLRPPGYPLMAGLLQVLPGRWEDGIVIFQLALGVAMAVIVAAAGWHFFGRATGVLAGLLLALSPLMIGTERLLTPDYVFALVILLGAIALAEAVRRPHGDLRLLAAAGLLFGIATYFKPVGLALFPAGLPALALSTRSLRRTLLGSVVLAAALAAIVLPWCVRNWIAYDTFTFSDRGGITLSVVAFGQDKLAVPDDTREGKLIRSTKLRGGRRDVLGELRRKGYSDQEAVAVQGRAAKQAIRRHPGRYLKGVARNVRELVHRTGQKKGGIASVPASNLPDLPVLSWVTARSMELGGTLQQLWYTLTIHSLLALALLVRPRTRAAVAMVALLTVWGLVMVATSMTTLPSDSRFAAEGAPLLYLAGVAGLCFAASAIWVRRRPGPDPADRESSGAPAAHPQEPRPQTQPGAKRKEPELA